MLIHEIGPQSYGQVAGEWYVRVPSSRKAVKLSARNAVTEHEDGTITVAGDLLTEHWHGRLVRGKFIPC